MAIFGAIPMPQNSGDVMSGHVNNMIKQLMDRQHQEQQQKQYQSTLAQQQQQHKDAMGFQQQTQNRLNQMLPLQIQALNDAHDKMQFETNPAKRMEYMKQIVQGIKNMRENPAGGAQPQDQQMPMEQPSFPMFQGGGMPGMQQQQAQQQQQQVAPPSMEQLQQGFGGLTPEEIQTAEMAGIKFPKPYETPQMKSDRKGREATQVLDIKERRDLERELPVVEDKLKSIDELIKLTKDAPNDWFGAGVGGFDVLGGPGQRKRGMTDKRYGTMETLFGDLIAPQAQEFSSKGLASALKMATEIKPGFGENKNIALGKLEHIKKKMKEAYAREQSRLGRVGGKVAPRDWSHLSNEELQRLAGQ
ncbi:hypothetical protein [Thiocapsa sp. N5-Cardenillas]|uniref:hypothetical protein n=1 Tax=Thiocapsa sp. N5-Cardenillas TaxID=3137397 RepID=UPI0035B45AE0